MATNQSGLRIGIDADILSYLDYIPEVIKLIAINQIRSLIQFLPETKFRFLLREGANLSALSDIVDRHNVEFKENDSKACSDLDLYHVVDHITLVIDRKFPMLFVPKTIPTTLNLHGVLPGASAKHFLSGAENNLVAAYLHALEMVSASASYLLTPNSYESKLISAISAVPLRQVCDIGFGPAIPDGFSFNQRRWDSLQARLGLDRPFLLVPSDTLSEHGEGILTEFLGSTNIRDNKLLIIRPRLAPYITNFWASPSPTSFLFGSHLFQPQLEYDEFLELLGRSQGLFLPGRLNSTFGMTEANFFNTPVYLTEAIGVDGILVGSPQELAESCNDLKIMPKELGDPISQWARTAERTFQTWRSLVSVR